MTEFDEGTPLPLWQLDDKPFYNASQAIDAIVENYPVDDEDDAEALGIRIEAAWQFADIIQQKAIEGEDLSSYTDAEKALLTTPRSFDLPDDVTWPKTWEHDIPLFLTTTEFEPITGVPEPVGNVRFIDPGDEVSFLDSLADLGFNTPRRVDENW